MMKEYDVYLKAKADRVEAEKWHDLPNSRKDQSDSFNMSAALGNLVLMRCGQHGCGGQNYWESPKALNAAILAVIENDPAVIVAAIERLRDQERDALIACKASAEALMGAVAKAEEESK